MINTAKPINTTLQTSLNCFEDIFIPLTNRNGFTKSKIPVIPVYFYRCIGTKENSTTYYEELATLDQKLFSLGSLYLKFTGSIPITSRNNLLTTTLPIWEKLGAQGNPAVELPALLHEADIFPRLGSDTLCVSLENAFFDVLTIYEGNSTNINTTLIKNFSLKLLNWLYDYVPNLFQNFNLNTADGEKITNPKVLFYGDIKEHEAYFLILLSKLGADILYLHTLSDDKFPHIDKKGLYSYVQKLPRTEALKAFPHYKAVEKEVPPKEPVSPPASPVQLERPNNQAAPTLRFDRPATLQSPPPIPSQRTEKTLEELAKLSSSTVMIRTFDHKGEFLGGGSGVVIDRNGLIVTNYHVVEDGLYFGVVFEGMDEHTQYETYTLVNANKQWDVALIKIHQKTTPIEINRHDDVVRGQRVVAIGSPLGLMNTFSEGIISGFRKSHRHDFVQTTAPMSPGSSGGALLNMYGELIGVSTAIYIDGQNLNLAVPSKYVLELLSQNTTRMNLEVIENYYAFSFNNFKVTFDAFFMYQPNDRYRIGFYQCKNDRSDLLGMIRNQAFLHAFESYYIDNIMRIAAKYGIDRYDFELGSQNYIFTYAYDFGRISNKEWKPLK
ncbi:MAG: trypsin-like peptidase domain-containing protein [Clostridia bacterium]|nr:trypsin-like peptidase domain-containing protein [Clostridia bacterium]